MLFQVSIGYNRCMLTRLEFGDSQGALLETIPIVASEQSIYLSAHLVDNWLNGWHVEDDLVQLSLDGGSWRWGATAEFASVDGSEPRMTASFYLPVADSSLIDYTRPVVIVLRVGDEYYVDVVFSIHAARVLWLLLEPLEYQARFLAGAHEWRATVRPGREEGEYIRLDRLEPAPSSQSLEEPVIFTTS